MGEVRDELRRLAEAIRVSTQHGVQRRRRTSNLVAAAGIGLVILWFLVAFLGLLDSDPRHAETRDRLAAMEQRIETVAKQVRALRVQAKQASGGARRGGAGKPAGKGPAAARKAAEPAAGPAEADAAGEGDRPAKGGSGGRFVRVTVDNVNIRGEPELDSQIIGKAASGDVFELERRLGEWYTISMFSGEDRYIFAELAETTGAVPPVPRSAETRTRVCEEISEARQRAGGEAGRRYPENGIQRFDHERLLTDRFLLEIYQRHGVAPARRGQVAALCARIPPPA